MAGRDGFSFGKREEDTRRIAFSSKYNATSLKTDFRELFYFDQQTQGLFFFDQLYSLEPASLR